MKESEAYKTYHDLATEKVQPKPKYVRRSSRTKSDEAPKPSSGKRVKATTKVANSQPSGSGTHEGTGVTPGVPDVPKYRLDDEQLSWKSSDEEDDDDDEANVGKDEDDDDHDNDDERTKSDNDGEDFVHPKFSTHDDEARQEEVNEKDSFDPRVQTPSHVESTDDDEIQSANVTGEDMDKEATNIVLVTTIAEPPLVSITTLPPPPTPLITHLQQTLVPTPATVLSSSLQDLPNFGSLFGFDHRLKTLETNFSKLKQTNQFVAAVSLIPSIVDAYLANKMHEAVKTTVQLQSNRLRDESQAENEDFLNKLDDNIKKIIKDQVKAQVSKILPKIDKTVNEQLEAEVLTRSPNESKASHVIAANVSELELKKILIDKMESNKSIHISDEQKNLYKALVDTYESDELILDTYGDNVSFKRRRDDKDNDEEPSAGLNRGSKRRKVGKEPESTSAPKEKTSKTTGKSTEGSKSHHKSAGESAQVEEPRHTAKYLEEPVHLEIEEGVTEDQPDEETS
ncbi:hypothetical protein Tco_0684876 [Tanacetum coccineum]